MPRIQANRDTIDDRFSVLGFTIRTESPLFEVADLNSSVELHFHTDAVPLNRLAAQAQADRIRSASLNPDHEAEAAASRAVSEPLRVPAPGSNPSPPAAAAAHQD